MPATSDFFNSGPRNSRSRLTASVELMRELSRSSDPHEMYQLFARRMDELFPVARRLTISRRGLHYPEYRVTRCTLWKESIDPWKEAHRLPLYSGGLLAELLYSDEPQVIDHLEIDADDPAGEFLAGQQSLLAIPQFELGAAINAIVLGREDAAAFPRDRIPDLVMMSNLFARATQTLVLSKAVREAYESLDFELRTVADIQKALLPTGVPRLPGLDVAVHLQPAKRAGGDYYDFFSLPGGQLGVLIADASGHGAPAAVLMAMTHAITHTLPHPVRPGELLTHLNAHLARRYTRPTGSFVTAFYAVFDPVRGTLTYASAGHTPPRLRRREGSRAVLNRAQRLPLGIKPDEVYPEQAIPLCPGDRVAFFTDGVIEAMSGEGEVFGTGRIDAILAAEPSSAEDLLKAILASWDEFTAGIPSADDRTLVVVQRDA
ncbi:MAG TPA: PP2C family protein-serine/threonine phosphatase [Gemmataceae bacterium]|jgi:sigma-B regulation protein RsbU (phosphoserine phosphatase)